MNAKEMFEELDYTVAEDSDALLLYQYKNPQNLYFGIFFWKKSKEYQHRLKERDGRESAWHTNTKEHQAIHQQLIELKWINQ